MNLLLKEGVILYINNAEVIRLNMDYSFSYGSTKATHSFGYYRYVTSSFTHQYFQQGDNCIAVEIHPHVTSTSPFYFALDLLQLSSSEYHFYSPYPFIHSSVNDTSCYFVINSHSPYHSVWKGKQNDYIFYEHAGYNYHYINAITLTRTDYNVPQSFTLYGVILYYDQMGIQQETNFKLLQQDSIEWGDDMHKTFSIPSAKTSYHAYLLRTMRIVSLFSSF